MIDDPIVAEVRKIRDQYAAKFNYDLDAIYRDLKEREKASGRSYVRYPPRRCQPQPSPAPAAEAQRNEHILTAEVIPEPEHRIRDEQIAAEPRLPPLDLPPGAVPAPMEAHRDLS